MDCVVIWYDNDYEAIYTNSLYTLKHGYFSAKSNFRKYFHLNIAIDRTSLQWSKLCLAAFNLPMVTSSCMAASDSDLSFSFQVSPVQLVQNETDAASVGILVIWSLLWSMKKIKALKTIKPKKRLRFKFLLVYIISPWCKLWYQRWMFAT